ncbi:Hpt domain protein [Pseudomonas caricapapayae]|uniref:Hpt domain protein n=1 Tax=Pseudomonas caricapapayae TaxID=46678 RepID=A0A0P9K2D6_9PSED|nr:Hpt domain-containing protein [Pseudomonas caricapapayae]KAA8694771.1 Hpt domain-containing protein [Pseudomonas caricapapayae]KPW56497.1 Hpt domain protein [Pseudomonas caricapapayae]RMM05226.1 Hpt domain protein [Pseudomonas caricapapayae]RMV73468.1 Hpt domain protein [Pseudomonas caricapapayae]RMV98542.1 Hpt domain protein [Pseudomonas caricapapayae]
MSIHLDYSVLNALQEVMEDEYPTLLDVFLKDSEQRIAQLLLAVQAASPDFQELSLTAHSFKGSSSNMGALQLSELCRQLEEQARQQRFTGLTELIGKIDSEYMTIRGLFNSERQLFVS